MWDIFETGLNKIPMQAEYKKAIEVGRELDTKIENLSQSDEIA